jgi:lipopolysaccharide export system ATP-binding protein
MSVSRDNATLAPGGLKPVDGAPVDGKGDAPLPAADAGPNLVNGHRSFTVNGETVDPVTMPGLCAYHLGKRYKKKPVVRDVSIGVQRGEAVGLLGPNGAGKTTCFYIITGLIKADAGAIYLDGDEVTDLPMFERARGGIGYLPQEASIFRGMSVEDNIMAVLEIVDNDPASRNTRLNDLLMDFSIAHLRKVPALALSGGERRRCEIARALATRPSYILLDEPLAGIDPIAVNDIRDIISHLKDRGIGVLITDHNVRDTLEIVDRAYILHEGEVLREGSPADIVADENVRRVYLGERFSL